jgi:hypothetical protein
VLILIPNYQNGEKLITLQNFQDHASHGIPVQVYDQFTHADIGFVQEIHETFVIVNKTQYSRELFKFISRPGY